VSASGDLSKALELARGCSERARGAGKHSLFGITCTANRRNPPLFFSGSRDTAETAGVSAILGDAALGPPLADLVDGMVDLILIDAEPKLAGWPEALSSMLAKRRQSRVLTYHPNDLTARATDALLAELGSLPSKGPVAILGAGHVGVRIAQRLAERGHVVRLWRRDTKALEAQAAAVNALRGPAAVGRAEACADVEAACRGAAAVLGCAAGMPVVTEAVIRGLGPGALLIDVGNGTFDAGAVEAAHARGLTLLCVNIRDFYEGDVASLLRVQDLVGRRIARRTVGAATLISGGILGRRGEVIVDDAARPSQIYGIADGRGDVVIPMDAPEWGAVLRDARRELQRKEQR
jgi:hypothetical protein